MWRVGCKKKYSTGKGDTEKFTQRPCDKQRVVKIQRFTCEEFLVLIVTTVLSANRRSVLIVRVCCRYLLCTYVPLRRKIGSRVRIILADWMCGTVADGSSKVLVRKCKDDPNIFKLARICPSLFYSRIFYAPVQSYVRLLSGLRREGFTSPHRIAKQKTREGQIDLLTSSMPLFLLTR